MEITIEHVVNELKGILPGRSSSNKYDSTRVT